MGSHPVVRVENFSGNFGVPALGGLKKGRPAKIVEKHKNTKKEPDLNV
jgi:hypothetical protein